MKSVTLQFHMNAVTEKKKLRVGWFTFTCSEDSTIVFTELLNDHWKEWKKTIDFRHARILRTHNVFDELDVAFVEGAISSEEQASYLKEIRGKATLLVAIGACAVTGLPSAQRNRFDEATNKEIDMIVTRFRHLPKVQALKEVVPVDAEVPGCPMNEKKFLEVVDMALKKFGITP